MGGVYGAGWHRGGDGLERCLRFLEPMQVTILSSRRDTRPFGQEGGDDGQRGKNWYIDPQGTRHRLAASTGMNMPAGGGS